jgi:hypothetical protein
LTTLTVRRWSWGLGVASVTAVAALGVASWQAQAAPPSPGTPPGVAAEQPRVTDPSPLPEPAVGLASDALTTNEVDRARAIALTPQLRSGARDVTGAAGPEYLSAAIVAESTQRRAELYFYDYRGEKLIKQVVDLGTGTVVGSYAATGMQAPAAAREVDTALDLVLASPLAGDLRTGFAAAAGRAFTGKQDVVVTAHTYQARPADTGAKQCGQSRCLQLMVQVKNGPFVELNDIIIDLSGRTVARLK